MNTEYLSHETVTTTIDDVPVTTSVGAQISVETAEADAKGIVAGDVTVLLSDSLRSSLNDAVKAAAQSCGAAAKIRKRDGRQKIPELIGHG